MVPWRHSLCHARWQPPLRPRAADLQEVQALLQMGEGDASYQGGEVSGRPGEQVGVPAMAVSA